MPGPGTQDWDWKIPARHEQEIARRRAARREVFQLVQQVLAQEFGAMATRNRGLTPTMGVVTLDVVTTNGVRVRIDISADRE